MIPSNKDAGDESSVEDSFILSRMGRKIPARALAAILLWCNLELLKFSAAFGGTRVLGNLALIPLMRTPQASPFLKKLMGMSLSLSGRGELIAEQRNQLRAAKEMREFALAATLKQKLAEREGGKKRRRSGSKMLDDRLVPTAVGDDKDRQSLIEIAAKCINQAFQFASENWDLIGLLLMPRLAEYIRSRLKECKVEIAQLLEGRWSHITVDWNNDPGLDSVSNHRWDRMGNLQASARSDG